MSSTAIAPAAISPRRPVPDTIARPEYVDKPAPAPFTGSEVKDAETIAKMRVACRLAAQARELVGSHVAPGVTTDELDLVGHEFLCDHGAYPSTLGYKRFPKSLCTSVNEVVCHGIPDARVLEDGDIVNIDITAYLDGVHGDTNATFCVGRVDPESRRLVKVTEECLDLGIEAVRPGAVLSDIGRAIETHAHDAGFFVVRAFVGHGIGEVFHGPPQVPHYYERAASTVLEPGMVFTIEPMITMGSVQPVIWPDGWTAATSDGSRTAQFEHTVLVTDAGVDVLTR
jgi:methionyl aminopeptidase